ncbi:PIN domain-containing protein [bacterium]|nr:PIN domain-containing protein [bacterium]
MIVDTSAVLAILYQEEDAADFAEAIAAAQVSRMSAANFLEAAINVDMHGDAEASRQLDAFIRPAGIVIDPVTLEQVQIARQAYIDFGKGRHPAGLNFGDCFAYALARITREPLLFKGDDFSKTDVSLYRRA